MKRGIRVSNFTVQIAEVTIRFPKETTEAELSALTRKVIGVIAQVAKVDYKTVAADFDQSSKRTEDEHGCTVILQREYTDPEFLEELKRALGGIE